MATQLNIVGNAVVGIVGKASDVTSVVVPPGVDTIGDRAFRQCSSLTSVTLPDSLRGIGVGAFSRCSGLTSLTLPDSLRSIGMNVFSGCSPGSLGRPTPLGSVGGAIPSAGRME